VDFETVPKPKFRYLVCFYRIIDDHPAPINLVHSPVTFDFSIVREPTKPEPIGVTSTLVMDITSPAVDVTKTASAALLDEGD